MSMKKIIQRVKHLIQGIARCHAHQEHPPKGYKGPVFGPERDTMTKKEIRRSMELYFAHRIEELTKRFPRKQPKGLTISRRKDGWFIYEFADGGGHAGDGKTFLEAWDMFNKQLACPHKNREVVDTREMPVKRIEYWLKCKDCGYDWYEIKRKGKKKCSK